MSVALTDKKYTLEDYMKLNDNQRYELIEGELIVVPSPSRRHQKVGVKLITQFENFLSQTPLGEIYYDFDVILGDKVVAPDLLFISKERLGIAGETNVKGAPDLVIEILSLSTAAYDRKKNSKLYFTHEVKEYWLVDPDTRLVEVFTAGEKDWRWVGVYDQEDVLTTPLLPGMEVKLSDVFK